MQEPALQGRTCVLTGGTSGIGRAAAIGLVAAGARLILLARDPARARATVAALNRTGPGRAEAIEVDLASLAAVRRAAAAILSGSDAVHVLVNCAATIQRTRTATEDGYETQWAVNHLAPFLLTTLLIDRLRASAPARVITLTSQVEASGRLDLNGESLSSSPYDPIAVYCQTKLANALFAFELARRLGGTGVTSNCLHPGIYATRLLHDYVGRPRVLRFLTTMRNPRPDAGGAHVVRLAADPALATTTGVYFHEGRPAQPSPRAQDGTLAAALWTLSEQQVAGST